MSLFAFAMFDTNISRDLRTNVSKTYAKHFSFFSDLPLPVFFGSFTWGVFCMGKNVMCSRSLFRRNLKYLSHWLWVSFLWYAIYFIYFPLLWVQIYFLCVWKMCEFDFIWTEYKFIQLTIHDICAFSKIIIHRNDLCNLKNKP